MAGLTMTVCLPAGTTDVRAALNAAMDPFRRDIDGVHFDRQIWDHWRISGDSHRGGYWVVPGMEIDPRLIHDDPMGGPMPCLPRRCAGGPRGLLDLDEPFRVATADAGAAWDIWHHLVATQPPARSLAEFFAERHSRPEGYSTQGALAAHRAQPLIRELAASGAAESVILMFGPNLLVVEGSERALEQGLINLDPAVAFAVPRHEFVAWHQMTAIRTTGVLTLDGWWCEQDDEPVHAICHSRKDCPHLAEVPNYGLEVDGYLARLPDDVILVTISCHV